jgi:hypothetical protein
MRGCLLTAAARLLVCLVQSARAVEDAIRRDATDLPESDEMPFLVGNDRNRWLRRASCAARRGLRLV